MNKDFIEELISGGESTPPQTQEQKMQDNINTLAHRMEESIKTIQKEIDSIKNEREEIKHEEITNNQSEEGHGQESSLQNDTIANNDND